MELKEETREKEPRLRIRTKMLILFLGLSILSLAIFGYLAFDDIKKIGRYSLESSTTLSESAINDSTRSLEALGETVIRQKAEDVALQCRIYINAHPKMTIRNLQTSPEFRKIAVQSVGETGYTILYEKETGIMRFHPNPELLNFDMHEWKDKLPEFWDIFEETLDGSPADGYYDWQDPDGEIRQKYMYIAPVQGTPYMVGATTYIDEFSIPVNQTKKDISAATLEIRNHVNDIIRKIRNTFIQAFIVIILIVAGLSFMISRMITDPIRALTRGVRAIGRGEMEVRVDIKTGDELEDLAASFNKMIADLKTHMEDLRRATAEKEGFLKELEIARGLQQRLLPQSPPDIEGFDLAASNIPAKEVGGDFYDFIPIAGDHWGLAIADVSGKGMPAAMFMGLSRTIIRTSTTSTLQLAAAIKQANDLICRDSTSGMFVTLFYAVLDVGKKELKYINAGHNPPLFFKRATAETVLLKARGIALGVSASIELEEEVIKMAEGDVLVLYTDGVTEAINQNREEFGLDRLIRFVMRNNALPAVELIHGIEKEVMAFAEGQPQFDDITLLVLKAIEK
ncbi:MAG: SpoIIE family protein phosphatase [Syntrophales bacterium]